MEEKAVDRAHRLLIARILDGTYPIGSELPGERSLSKDLGVARNGLREAMQRLSLGGWLDISQGKATRVRDYLHDGNLNILIALLNTQPETDVPFMGDLLRMWSILARDYTVLGIQNQPVRIVERLELYTSLADTPEACSQAMWQLHRALLDYSGNIVYGLIFNTFTDFYQRFALLYYRSPETRIVARQLWQDMHVAIRDDHIDHAADLLANHILSVSIPDYEQHEQDEGDIPDE